MANNGNGRDTILLKKMIKEQKLLPLLETDDYLTWIIKCKLNNVIKEDIIVKKSYHIGNKTIKYLSHSAWNRINQTVTVINKIRQQNWFWKYFNI